MKQRIRVNTIPDSVLHNLASRDAVLWVGPGFDETTEQRELLRRLIELPWQLVLCESTSALLAKSLESSSQTVDRLTRRRAFLHLVASDPEALQLPPRALPVFFLNGLDDASDPEESSHRTARAMQRRRLNMINRLQVACPRILLVLSSGRESPLDDVFDLWRDGFRSLLVVQSSSDADAQRVEGWLAEDTSAPAVEHCAAPFQESLKSLIDRASLELAEDRYVVRIQTVDGAMKDLDVTECELLEQPIFDRYELVQVRDLPHIEPHELSAADLTSFFDRSTKSWKAFAAGVPWQRDTEPNRAVRRSLAKVAAAGPSQNSVLVIACESGAGGTTRARTLAMDVARLGYPTLVARPLKFHPMPTELETFLYRVRQRVLADFDSSTNDASTDDISAHAVAPPETPWLLVFDVQHWEGRRSEIAMLSKALARSGRPAVLLVVTGADIGDELESAPDTDVIEILRHELSEADALALGEHLNKFLKPFGKDKTASQWRYFWERHCPIDMETDVASFWITLEFWLKGQLDLSESVQEWVARQFNQAALTDDARAIVLEIAALSIERQPFPESLLPPSPNGQFPYSVILSDVRSEVPALALVCDGTPPYRQWAMAHDLLGRYLVNSLYFDRVRLTTLGLDSAEDPVHLRLILLRRIATRSALGRTQFASLAREFAVNILKLGADGNLEFARYWKEVLAILEAMPRAIWETNRTFNHHIAISRRRVATMDEIFHLSLEDKYCQLTKAVEQLDYALHRLERIDTDDEPDLNLLNSLSLAYQNLADVEFDRGATPQRVLELREKATEAARRAQKESPTNSYVLETFAKNLLQNGRLYPDQAVVCAAEALGYIYQAMSLDRSLLRETRLTKLANDGIAMLRQSDASDQLDRVCAAGNPLGFLGKAWLVLSDGEEHFLKEHVARLPREKVDAALAVIDKSPVRANALLLRFRYDLIAASDPRNFEEQLNLLDELEGTGYSIPLQLQLEHAILLHQRNRHEAANLEFKNIRQQSRLQEVFLEVPQRLRWLRTPDGKQRICHARVVETRDRRAHAKVKELKDATVPFIPQEFGKSRMTGTFRCLINFGAMGPFIKPPDQGEASA